MNKAYPKEMPNLKLLCAYCEIGDVIMTYKNYRHNYKGMCENEKCQIWHTAWVSK